MASKPHPTPTPSLVLPTGGGSSSFRPPEQLHRINSDAHFNVSTGRGSNGIVCRDLKGSIISGITSKIFATSALVVEALTLREAIALVVSLNLPSIFIESNCM